MNLNRREMLCAAAVAILIAAHGEPRAHAHQGTTQRSRERSPAPTGELRLLPGEGNELALTVDDGASVEVVAAFAQLCRDTGIRLTFFVNGVNPAWTINAGVLRPLVDAGQVQVGNHTWSHPHLTALPPDAVADQIRRNADFLRNAYGTDGTPYLRPPYGEHNTATDRIAADLGYSTITMWSGTVGDSLPISEAALIAAAAQSFRPQQIVLAHANLPTITHCYGQLVDLIHSRNLETVTLNDVFA